MVDMIAIPERLEDAVGETEHHDVLNRFFPKIMINAINLIFGQHTEKFVIERLRGRQVGAERLLYDYAAPLIFLLVGQPGTAQLFHDHGKYLRWRCQIKQAVAAGVVLRVDLGQELFEFGISLRVIEFALKIEHAFAEPFPVGIYRRFRANLAAEGLIVAVASGDANDGELLRQQSGFAKVVERRNQQALGKIASSAEDHEDAGAGG